MVSSLIDPFNLAICRLALLAGSRSVAATLRRSPHDDQAMRDPLRTQICIRLNEFAQSRSVAAAIAARFHIKLAPDWLG
jgi:hypothetical protein